MSGHQTIRDDAAKPALKRRTGDFRAFTLIELMVMIAIIAILAVCGL